MSRRAASAAATVNEVWQVWNDRLAWDAEPVAEIIPECDTEFGGGAHQSQERIATVAAVETACATTGLALGDGCPFILPMSGKSWKSTIRGIRVFDARLLFTTSSGERTASSYRCGIRPAFCCSSLAGCSILSRAQR